MEKEKIHSLYSRNMKKGCSTYVSYYVFSATIVLGHIISKHSNMLMVLFYYLESKAMGV